MTRNDQTDGDDRYLFVVDYEDDAERKRVEYLFNNWDDGDVEKPSGLVRVADGVDHDELYEDLVGKVPADQVASYRLEPVEPDVTTERYTVEQSVDAQADAVESFVEYMLSKKKAVLQSAARNEYEVYTKKGRATVTYGVDGDGDGGTTTVTVRVDGYPPAPSFLADFFETELADYANSQQ
ncbi:MAG: hypothetical protein ABEJ40_05805 [Haloarculaceae archaeon]